MRRIGYVSTRWMHAFKKQAEDRSIFRDFYRNNTYKNKRLFLYWSNIIMLDLVKTRSF